MNESKAVALQVWDELRWTIGREVSAKTRVFIMTELPNKILFLRHIGEPIWLTLVEKRDASDFPSTTEEG